MAISIFKITVFILNILFILKFSLNLARFNMYVRVIFEYLNFLVILGTVYYVKKKPNALLLTYIIFHTRLLIFNTCTHIIIVPCITVELRAK